MKPYTPSSWKAMLLSAAAFAAGVAVASCSDTTAPHGTIIRRRINTAFAVTNRGKKSSPLSSTPPRYSSAIIKCNVGGSTNSLKNDIIGSTSATWLVAAAAAADDFSNTAATENNNEVNHRTLKFSESDAIRILRAIPRNNNDDKSRTTTTNDSTETNMKSCHTAMDVLFLLNHASPSPPSNSNVDILSPTSLASLSEEELLLPSVIEPIVDAISPNIAAAALRRLTSPPFLPPSLLSSTHHGSRRHIMSKYKKWLNQVNVNNDALDRKVHERLIELLVKKLSAVMEYQSQDLASSSSSTIIAQQQQQQQQQHHANNNNRRRSLPVLLPHCDSWIVPPTFTKTDKSNKKSMMTMNWYALADLLYSTSNLCDVLGNRHSSRNHGGNNNKNNNTPFANISPREQCSIMNLFDSVIRYLSWNDKMSSSFARCVGPRRLVRDVIQPLVAVEMARRKANRGMEDWIYNVGSGGGGDAVDVVDDEQFPLISPNDEYDRLVTLISSYLVLPHAIDKLTASDLSATLWAMTKIYHPLPLDTSSSVLVSAVARSEQQQLTLQCPQRALLRSFMKRLRKYPVRSSARGKELVKAIWSVARLIGYLEEQDRRALHPYPSRQVLPLPIRLPGEEEEEGGSGSSLLVKGDVAFVPMSPTQCPNAADSPKDAKHVSTETLREEAVIMYHTLVKEIAHPPVYSNGQINDANTNGNNPGVEGIKLNTLSLGQIADVLQSATSLGISHDDITVAITEILKHLTSNPQSALHQCRSCRDISRILLALQRLRVGTGVFDDMVGLSDISSTGDVSRDGSSEDMADNNAVHNSGGLEKRCVQLLGEKFLDIVRWHHERQSKFACDAKTLAIILRAGVMMFQGNSTATVAMLNAATILILDQTGKVEDDEDWASSSFLSSCNEFEVSNYLFAFALAKRFDEEVFTSLTDQMAEDYILDSCSPSSASRAMWSCSMILSLDGANSHISNSDNKQNEFALSISGESFLHERQIDLFHQLAPLLLFSPLSPTDTSCAMWAMAKAQYVIDKGIFDQLAMSLASEAMLKRSNTRLVSQALWSCGKMVEFEDSKIITRVLDDRGGDAGNASENAINLPPYVKCADEYIRFLITNQAQLTPKHVCQAIWAIGRLRLSDYFLVQKMVDIASHLCHKLNAREIANIVWGLSKVDYDKPEVVSEFIYHAIATPEDITAQEAANMLFALGKLQIHEKEAFESLSSILRNQLHEATSQAIANALWAHEVVGIEPPPELLSTWAQDRLGMLVLGTVADLNNDNR